MKLDLNKPWVMRLVKNNSLANGCSFIRGVILGTLWRALVWTAAVTGISVLFASLLGGLYMWFTNPAFITDGFPRMEYFGTDMVAQVWSGLIFLGMFIWAAVAICGIAVGVVWLVIKATKTSSHAIARGTRKAWKAIKPSDVVQESFSAWYNNFCPKLEIILPTHLASLVVNARVQANVEEWDYDLDEHIIKVKLGTIMTVEQHDRRLDVGVLWDETAESINNGFAEDDNSQWDSPEDKEECRLRSLLNCTRDYRFRFAHPDDDDIKLTVVEESSSPA